MSALQHERITALAQELRLGALPDLYGPIAQSAAKKKDASYADFLEDVDRPRQRRRRTRRSDRPCSRARGTRRRRGWVTTKLPISTNPGPIQSAVDRADAVGP